MKKQQLSLRVLKNTKIGETYKKLLTREELDSREQIVLLQTAIILMNVDDVSLKKMGYRIVLMYANRTKDYIPLYDVALNLGYIPIAKTIEGMDSYKEKFENKFFNMFFSSFKESFKVGNNFLTFQQFGINKFFNTKNGDESVAVVAPTSYGKSELIISTVNREPLNVCILVPTKALIAQTKRRILNSSEYRSDRKIITHPDMFTVDDSNVIAVLTQERLLRLLQKFPSISFSQVFVDEAHNLLDDEKRGRLLAASIILLTKKNEDVAFQFLTPFLMDVSNLRVAHTLYFPKELRVDEYLKTERLYSYDFLKKDGLKIYDQYLDKKYDVDVKEYSDVDEFIKEKSGGKNILYFNKPASIEKFVRFFMSNLNDVSDAEIEKACEVLGSFLHKDYLLIKCLKKGVVYHHGSVPDNVKLYIENLFSKVGIAKYLVTTSTLLEGVNIPAEKLFMLDNKKGTRKLTPSQFKNLVGRVCRFSEIFSTSGGDLNKLEPEIYILKSRFMDPRANIDDFLKDSMKVDKKMVEIPENVLLEKSDNSDEERNRQRLEYEDFIENIEPGTLNIDREVAYAKTEFGISCFANNIDEIDVVASESECQRLIDSLREDGRVAQDVNEILDLINSIFIGRLKEKNEKSSFARLSEEKARNFYSIFLDWRTRNASYSEMIRSFLTYWEKIDDPIIFVGKWGDRTRGEGRFEYWTDISSKGETEKVNLAIVRIKEEQDFLDNEIIKFIEVINDMGLIDAELYQKIKFGTSDPEKILLIKNGLSSSLASLLIKKYKEFLEIDLASQRVVVKCEVREAMRVQNESDLLIFEVGYSLADK